MTARSLDIIMALGAALALLLGGFAGFAEECDEIPSEVLRLHIPANSDSPRDQEIKLALRDCVLQEYGTQLSGARSREEAADTVRGLLPEIEKTCCEFLSQQGVDYGAEAELTEMYYQALRITLGSGEGHNWWCVMYPAMCIPLASQPADTLDTLPEDFTGNRVEFRFAVYEFFKSLFTGE